MREDDFDKTLRDRLKAYSEEPKESTWDDILSGMENRPTPLGERLGNYEELPDEFLWKKIQAAKGADRQLAWADHLAALAAILLLVFAWQIRPTNSERTQVLVPKNETHSTDSVRKIAENKSSTNELSPETRQENNESHVRQSIVQPKVVPVQEHSEGKPTNPAQSDVDQSLTAVERTMVAITPVEERTESNLRDSLPEKKQARDSVAAVSGEKLESPADIHVSEVKKENRRNSSFYFLAMPTLGYQQLSPVRDDGIFIDSYERVASFSPRRLGIRLEAGWEKQISPHLAMDVGVLYFQRQQTIGYTYNDSLHYEVTPVDNTTLTYELTAMSIPGSFDYEVQNIGALLGLNYTIETGLFIQKLGVAVEVHKNMKRDAFYLFGDVYYRLSYRIRPRLDLMLQPGLNYSVKLVEKLNAPFYVKPYGLGLSVGLMVHLGKNPNKE
jgi:hypothetical protein